MSKKKQQTSEPADDGLKGANSTYFHESVYKWTTEGGESFYTIDDIPPVRFVTVLSNAAGLPQDALNLESYRRKFVEACKYWLTPDIARAWLDRFIDELGVVLWNEKYNASKLAGLPEREWQTVADKALTDFKASVPTATNIFDKPRGRR